MMRQYELVERVLRYAPDANESLLDRAYVFAMKAHGNQKRASGDPYFTHPLEVAAILTEYELDDATIATALLHDTVEDTGITREQISELFGPTIGNLVDGLTKIERLNLVSKQAEQAENFRKLLIAISSDIRVLLVKLADRLHNMRTLEHMRPEKRQLIAQETMEIYAPLAARMGMQEIKDELEDLAFRWLHPDAFEALTLQLAQLHAGNRTLIADIEAELQARLDAAGIVARVRSREKRPYSIFRKMTNHQISLEQLSDIYGFRVIVDELGDCYRVLGVAHAAWRTVPGRFKDYISTPKQNGYRSIHSTVIGPGHQRVELQIRTAEMDDVAEFGVAAHSVYKDARNGAAPAISDDPAPYQWLRRLVNNLLEGDNPQEFLEHTKLELFQDQVFCFTPKGRLMALPRGSIPIDFAYAVHTKIGNACVGAKINGRHLPLITPLKNGDEVEIITADQADPPAGWEHVVVTGKARSAIRRATRERERRMFANLGRELLATAIARTGRTHTETELAAAAAKLGYKSVDDGLVAIGRDVVSAEQAIAALFPDLPPGDAPRRQVIKREEAGWFELRQGVGLRFRWPGESLNGAGHGAQVRSARDLPVHFAAGGAVPGERVVGILEPGEGIVVFPIDSPQLKAFDDELDRWIDATWHIEEGFTERFPARLKVTARNEPGTLARIAEIVGGTDGNIDRLQMLTRAPDFTDMQIDLEVWDMKHLTRIISGVNALPVVSRVERVLE